MTLFRGTQHVDSYLDAEISATSVQRQHRHLGLHHPGRGEDGIGADQEVPYMETEAGDAELDEEDAAGGGEGGGGGEGDAEGSTAAGAGAADHGGEQVGNGQLSAEEEARLAAEHEEIRRKKHEMKKAMRQAARLNGGTLPAGLSDDAGGNPTAGGTERAGAAGSGGVRSGGGAGSGAAGSAVPRVRSGIGTAWNGGGGNEGTRPGPLRRMWGGVRAMATPVIKAGANAGAAGAAALGDATTRKAALDLMHRTRLTSKEDLDGYVETLAKRNALATFGFVGSNDTHMGPRDNGWTRDDDSTCAGKCGLHGFCRAGKCVCVALWEGTTCNLPKVMPEGMHAVFNGHHVLNREKMREIPDLVLRYTTNPKASGGTHSFALPVSKDMVRFSPAHDPWRGRVYERCAVVGSSGVLRHYTFGNVIDRSNLVIRFNLAPTKGYRSVVGLKTNLRFVNTIHAAFHEGAEIDVMQMQSQVGVQLYLKFRKDAPKVPLLAFDPDFSAFVSSNVRTLPTGGYFAVWFALTNCVHVDLYGFHFRPGYGLAHHYFNSEKPKKGKVAIHDYDLEYEQIKRLAAAKLLTLAEPCVSGCPEKTRIPPTNLAPGGACSCKASNPLPVALPGFCRAQNTWSCFIKCPGGAAECPGGLGIQVTDVDRLDKQGIPTEPVDGLMGDCPGHLADLARDRMDAHGRDARKCATWEDVPHEYRNKHYLRDE